MKHINNFKKVLTLALSSALLMGTILAPRLTDKVQADEDRTLVVYSNSLSDARDAWLKQKAKENNFDLQFVAVGGGALYNRLLLEKNNPQGDVFFGLNQFFVKKLTKENVLKPYEPKWADKINREDADKDGNYWPIVYEPIMYTYDVEKFPNAEDLPKTWSELPEKFEGHYLVHNALGSATSQVVLSSFMSRYRDDNGKYGVSEEGWKAIENYYGKGIPSTEGVDAYADLKNGKVDFVVMWLTGKIEREKQYEIKTDALHPEDGTPMVMQFIGMVNGTKREKLAQEFIDWFGSAEIQGEWSKNFGTAPTNVAAKKLGDPEIIEFTDSFKPQQIDWDFVVEHLDQWVEEVQLNFLG